MSAPDSKALSPGSLKARGKPPSALATCAACGGQEVSFRAGESRGRSLVASAYSDPRDDAESGPGRPEAQARGGGLGGLVSQYGHKALALGTLVAGEKYLARVVAEAGIKFPSPLIGMFGIVTVLLVLGSVSPKARDALEDFFAPGLGWITRWLPLFYAPSLVVLPNVLDGMPGSSLLKILGVICVGMPVSLVVTAQVAITIRNLTNTPIQDMPPAKPAAPFTPIYSYAWGTIGVLSLLCIAYGPADWLQYSRAAFQVACTVGGYLFGVALPPRFSGILHPIITCSLAANLGAYIQGLVTGSGYHAALASYLTKGAAWGAGDLLMAFLGSVILTFGFKIYQQRALMVRHGPEIFGAVAASATLSLFATAALAHAIGLPPDLARALVPRSVTVAFAIPIAQQLGGTVAIAAGGVALTGLLGANYGQAILTRFGYTDPIARGLATAGAAHGLGTAALSRKEPEALPFCALAYALMGVLSTLLTSTPLVADALLSLTA